MVTGQHCKDITVTTSGDYSFTRFRFSYHMRLCVGRATITTVANQLNILLGQQWREIVGIDKGCHSERVRIPTESLLTHSSCDTEKV